MSATLTNKLEALLFAEGGPVTKKRLCQLLECNQEELEEAAKALSERQGAGIALIRAPSELSLAASPAPAAALETIYKKELSRDIGDAGLEVLSIILYRGPSTRASIDYIRGVNTSSTIRNLASRGLIERLQNPKDQREYLYRPTAELLAYIGVREASELPDYAKITGELAAFEREGGPFADQNDERADTGDDSE
ncbi:MAG TPA: SMC-Scp complex subunit ScpB [Candidatus Paceibacterota bacterium]